MRPRFAAGPFSLLGGQLLESTLDAGSKLVTLFSQLRRLGTRRCQLVAQALDLFLKLAQPRVRPRRAGSGVGQLELETLDGDLELTAFREQILDERLRRLCLLFRHTGKARAGPRAAGAARWSASSCRRTTAGGMPCRGRPARSAGAAQASGAQGPT